MRHVPEQCFRGVTRRDNKKIDRSSCKEQGKRKIVCEQVAEEIKGLKRGAMQATMDKGIKRIANLITTNPRLLLQRVSSKLKKNPVRFLARERSCLLQFLSKFQKAKEALESYGRHI